MRRPWPPPLPDSPARRAITAGALWALMLLGIAGLATYAGLGEPPPRVFAEPPSARVSPVP